MPHTADFIGKLRIKLIWYNTKNKRRRAFLPNLKDGVSSPKSDETEQLSPGWDEKRVQDVINYCQ